MEDREQPQQIGKDSQDTLEDLREVEQLEILNL